MKIHIVITVSDKHLGETEEIANRLVKDGLKITNVYEFGVITGIIEENNIKRISDYTEVKSLTKEKNISISPPDEDIQ